MFFFDLANNPLYSHAMAVQSAGEADATIGVFCMANYQFFADPVPYLLVRARKLGDTDWVNIEETPIDLSADNGLVIPFQLKLVADAVTKRHRVQPALRVRKA